MSGTLLAGEAGSVLVAAALAGTAPILLALEGLAEPAAFRGIRAIPVTGLGERGEIDRVGLIAGEAETRQLVEAWAGRHGLPVHDATPPPLTPPARCLAVSAPTTGSGKSALARKLARSLHRSGVRVVVVRHPIASLLHWPGRDGAELVTALDGPRPLDEVEELQPMLDAGVPVATGLDPKALLAHASGAQVVVWDGGGSAEPWIVPDIHVVALDLLRPQAAAAVADADVVVLMKSGVAGEDRVRDAERFVRERNADAALLLTDLLPAVSDGALLTGRAVVVVEDWPSLVLGGLRAGAGAVAAKRFRCGVVDPRPYAVGAVARALADHPHIGPVVPSLGRTPQELDDLRATIDATPGEVVLWASPAPPELVAGDGRPVVRVMPELIEVAGGSLQDVLRPLLPGFVGEVRRRRPWPPAP